MMKVALCIDIKQFHEDRLRDRAWSRQFPGSAWMTSLYERQEEFGIEVASGDVALQRVQTGQWRANEVHIVQEMSAWHGAELCRRGAVAGILTMLESPLVAFRQVDHLIRSRQEFRHCIGPGEIFRRSKSLRPSHHWRLAFPSYWRGSASQSVPWSVRSGAVLVAANKYWRECGWSRRRTFKERLRMVRHRFRRSLSPTFQSTRHLQLHDARLELLEMLGAKGMVDVFGRGWDDLSNLPTERARQLYEMRSALHGSCDDKHNTLRRYRFTIAYENLAFPGYVTEKLIDGLVSGTVPVYWGAPDIAQHVPPEACVNAVDCGSTRSIVDRMEHMPESEWSSIVDAGQEFLASRRGQRHTYEGFAEWIVEMLHGRAEDE